MKKKMWCIVYYFSNGAFGGWDYYANKEDAERAYWQRTHNGNFMNVSMHEVER